ncbi:hypothetical protein TBK1r_08220 [Stieleria magnilauensis]|uniref:Uncharacterized protein n=1 Tax=Stieleria magnilauensis TaxID=2527963 RepID=A0ABX5XIU0_9BACT|nr:hypothetical protein TBK1r_08220 [Planctomycetes bacterium TBK1r]
MIRRAKLTAKTYATVDELIRLGGIAVEDAQDESRRLGVPNVYSINGRLYYETPSGELSSEDPYREKQSATEPRDATERRS